jgi:hypothetical protein
MPKTVAFDEVAKSDSVKATKVLRVFGFIIGTPQL